MNIAADFFKKPVVFSTIATALFCYISWKWAFVLTTPSDPLEYLAPAFTPEKGFDYIDRIVLWYWLRLFALMPIAHELVGPIATLTQSALVLFISTWWLGKRFGLQSASMLVFLFILSPAWTSIASYTYPMQGMTLVIVAALIAMDIVGKSRWQYLIAGVGGIFASFSKVQGAGFILSAFGLALANKGKRVESARYAVLGLILASAMLLLIIVVFDGYRGLAKLVDIYFFTGVANKQYIGVANGIMPPFYSYLLEPSFLAAAIGLIIPFLVPKLHRLRPFSFTGIIQLFFLILIYEITKRGGALIPNYVLDSFTLGAISFAAGYSIIFQERENKLFSYLPYFFLLLILISLQLSDYRIDIPRQYYATDLLKVGGFNFLGIFPIISLLTLLATLLLLENRAINNGLSTSMVLFACCAIIVVSVAWRSEHVLSETKFRTTWSKPYHDIAKVLEKHQKEGVMVDVNLWGDVLNTDERIRWVFFSMYGDDSSEDNICFGNKCQSDKYRYLITDKPDIEFENISKSSNKKIELLSSITHLPALNAAFSGDLSPDGDVDCKDPIKITEREADKLIRISGAGGNCRFALDFLHGGSKLIRPGSTIYIRGISKGAKSKLYVRYYIDGKATMVYALQDKEQQFLRAAIPSKGTSINIGWSFDSLKEPGIVSIPDVFAVPNDLTVEGKNRYHLSIFDSNNNELREIEE